MTRAIIIIFLLLHSCYCDLYQVQYCLPELEIYVTCVGTNATSEVICTNDEDPTEKYTENTIFEIDTPKQIVELGDDTVHVDPIRYQKIDEGVVVEPPQPKIYNNLVLLIEFSNHRNRRIRYSRDLYDSLFNAIDADSTYYPTGSVKNYFQNQTYGQIILQSTVLPWYETNYTEEEATAGCSSLCLQSKLTDVIIQALSYFDQNNEINFPQFDYNGDKQIELVTIITSSRGGETGRVDDLGVSNKDRIWSHRWSLFRTFTSKSGGYRVNSYNVNPSLFSNVGTRITRIGVLAHEIFHAFNLPDLYDSDTSSSGLSVYGLMGSPWGIDRSQFYPPSLSPWTMEELDVIEVKPVVAGWNRILPSNLNSRTQIYKLKLNDDEAIYIDYKVPISTMRLHPEGILIYHCDNRVKTGNDLEWYPGLHKDNPYPALQHYRCRLIQRNGLFLLERQRSIADYAAVYYGNDEENVTLNDFTSNNINSWTNLEKLVDGGCVYSGHELTAFSKVAQGEYRFLYNFDETLAGQKCNASLILSDAFSQTNDDATVIMIVSISLAALVVVVILVYFACKKSKYD